MTLTRQTGEPLGIRINGGADGKRVNIDDPEDDGIFVTEVCFEILFRFKERICFYLKVKDGSPASGILTVGTRILEVRLIEFPHCRHGRHVFFFASFVPCMYM